MKIIKWLIFSLVVCWVLIVVYGILRDGEPEAEFVIDGEVTTYPAARNNDRTIRATVMTEYVKKVIFPKFVVATGTGVVKGYFKLPYEARYCGSCIRFKEGAIKRFTARTGYRVTIEVKDVTMATRDMYCTKSLSFGTCMKQLQDNDLIIQYKWEDPNAIRELEVVK